MFKLPPQLATELNKHPVTYPPTYYKSKIKTDTIHDVDPILSGFSSTPNPTPNPTPNSTPNSNTTPNSNNPTQPSSSTITSHYNTNNYPDFYASLADYLKDGEGGLGLSDDAAANVLKNFKREQRSKVRELGLEGAEVIFKEHYEKK